MASTAFTTAAVAAATAASATSSNGSGRRQFVAPGSDGVRSGEPLTAAMLAASRGGEMEKAARKLFDDCCGTGGVMRREDVAKVCQELQLSAFADQIAEEMGASSAQGARFDQFLAWYMSTLDDEMAASSKASTPSTGETTSSSMADASGSDIFERELMEIEQLTFPVLPGAMVVPEMMQPRYKPTDNAAATKPAVPGDDTVASSSEQDIARKVVQDLLSSADMNAMDLSDLATKIHQVTIKSLKNAVTNLQQQLGQAHSKVTATEAGLKQAMDDRAQLISNYERQVEICSSDIEDLRQQCCVLRGQLKMAGEDQLMAVERAKAEVSKQQAALPFPHATRTSQGPCNQCKVLNEKLATLTSQVDVALTLQSHAPSLRSVNSPSAEEKHMQGHLLYDSQTKIIQAGEMVLSKAKSVSKIESVYTPSTPDDDLSGSLKVSTLQSSPSRGSDVPTYQDRAAEWLQQQDSHLPVSPAHSGVAMRRQAELSQLVGEHFNAGQIDQLDTSLQQCASLDDVIQVVSVHTTAHFDQELKHSQLENERLESQMMCQEAEMNVLSVTLAESKDMADRLALQTRQLQSNNEVLEAAYECSLQRQHIFQLLLEASDLKALRMAIRVSRDTGCLPDDVASLPTLSWVHGLEGADFHDLNNLAGQLHNMEGNLFQKIHACLQPGNQDTAHSGSPLFDDQLARRLAHIAGRDTPQSEVHTRPPSVNSHGMSIDDESSIADSGHQSMLHSYASRNHSYSLSADLIRLQHLVKDLKEQQDNFVQCLAPVEILCNVIPSRTSSDMTHGRSAEELSVLFQQVVAENAVLLQDLAILVQDKANLKKRLYIAETGMAQLQQQTKNWQNREQALMTRHQQLLGELSSQRQRKLVLERELENVRGTLQSAKIHFASQSERDGWNRINPSRRSASCRHLTVPTSAAALQSNMSRHRPKSEHHESP